VVFDKGTVLLLLYQYYFWVKPILRWVLVAFEFWTPFFQPIPIKYYHIFVYSNELGDKLDGYQKKKYVCKLIFIFLLGNNIEFGHQEAVNLLASLKFSEKQIVSFCKILTDIEFL